MARVGYHRVHKQYPNGHVAIIDASFDVPDGSFTVLVGPSGCGKSTLLRMTAGLERITSGEIRIDDKRVNEMPPRDRDIAMVFQDYALYPHMTVAENMAYALKLRGLPRDEITERIASTAGILELEGVLGRRPGQLSGGQRQRVALGRAIVRNPKVFLFDEPLSNLDAKLRVQMRGEIARLHHRLEATMIYVTHDQVEAMTMGDRIVILRDGAIQQIASPMDVYTSPENQYVAGFIGSPPMNFLPVRITDEGRTLSGDGFALPTTPDIAAQGRLVPPGADGVPRAILGIRPEDMHDRLTRPDAPPDRALSAVTEVVEPLGADVYVSARLGSHLVTARFRGDLIPEIGARLDLVPDLARAHLFDASSGARLRD